MQHQSPGGLKQSNLKSDYESLLDDLNAPLNERDKQRPNAAGGGVSGAQHNKNAGFKLNEMSECASMDFL